MIRYNSLSLWQILIFLKATQKFSELKNCSHKARLVFQGEKMQFFSSTAFKEND
jgi:hypothetical protein